MSGSGSSFVFLPLGGAGEIGMNLNLYGFGAADDPEWLMIDLGVTFGNGSLPGIDVIMPDPSFIVERRDRLAGLVLTHAHEDHLGAVPYLWEQLGCPIYATPFTRLILDRKLDEAGLTEAVEVHEIELGGRFQVGPFDLELITLTHSIPEPNAIAVRTPAGTVLHTGDWKFDPDPVVGEVSDEAALRALGDEGVLAMVCDSTNVFSEGESGSEAELQEALTRLIGEATGRVAVACFASNVARLETIANAAQASQRDIVLAGRSLKRITAAARTAGYMQDVPAFLDEEDAGYLPDDKTLIICTGSQGEPRAALSRIAAGDHPRVTLGAGDRVIFSSRVIPGNETAIGRLQNQLVKRGIEIITWRDDHVHVSGHPARDELAHMYQLARPHISIPVHGEARHLIEHAALARECQVPHSVVVENGAMVQLAPGEPGILGHVTSGRLGFDGNRLVPLDGELIRERTRAVWNGTVVVSVVVDGDGELVADPVITTSGLLEAGETAALDVAHEVAGDAVDRLDRRDKSDDGAIKEAVRRAVRRSFRDALDKKPITTVHLVRVE